MPNPDDRSDNVEKLQRNIENTQANFREAEKTLRAYGSEMSDKDQNNIKEKNERRLDAIEGFREEIKDEIQDM